MLELGKSRATWDELIVLFSIHEAPSPGPGPFLGLRTHLVTPANCALVSCRYDTTSFADSEELAHQGYLRTEEMNERVNE